MFVRQAQIEADQAEANGEGDQASSTETAQIRRRVEQLRQQFQAIDQDQTGMVDTGELANALKSLNFSFDDKGIKEIVAEIDYYGNGMINYTEFIAAILSVEQTLTEEQLWTLFKKFDVDNTDYITEENLREAFNRQGRLQISRLEIDNIVRQHDTDYNGKISFEEFKKIFISANAKSEAV